MKLIFIPFLLLSHYVAKSQTYILLPSNYPTYWQVEEMNTNLNNISNELHDANQARENKEYWDRINAQGAQISQQNQLQENIRRLEIKQKLYEGWKEEIKNLYDSIRFQEVLSIRDFELNMQELAYRYEIFLLVKDKYKTFEEFENIYKQFDYNNLPF